MNAQPKVPWMGLVSILSAVVYGASPIDILPDVIPLLGWIDDAVLVPLLLVVGVGMFLRRRKMMAAAQPVIDVPTRQAPPQIPDQYRA